ncbi:hypothetical protein PV08_01689 [Exophiala spinifera]|uniref:lytic cellulose monooxygenase (C4-dehydrogenating) n=1 Tax=Exophiala spinifera TaxID=91928 RepID=A0A0D2BRT1_9EURO|nr:uncharacterized protein PV08_01689 [Exophiala spinifera]KIW21110.1 hypothetical protein PV08_01689 [Exophiala spinifera]
MSLIRSTTLVGALALVSKVSAHGIVSGIVAGGQWYSGYNPSFKYSNNPPVVAGWSIPDDGDYGFVSDYTSPDIICHKGATPGGAYVSVAAGESLELQWTVWPESHHGPMIDYLASCGDDCTTVDKSQLKFNKIDEAGLVNGSPAPGKWASDDMIANNNSWVVTIPSSIAPGKYVLRHETIALHSAFNAGGAQNYPQCINLEITGSGSTSLTGGTLGTELYTAQDPGILLNIYYPALESYDIPGPPLFDGASSSGGSSQNSAASASTSISAAVSTSASASASTSASALLTATPHSWGAWSNITSVPSKPIAVVSSTSAVAVEPTHTEAEEECPSETASVSFSSVPTVTSNVAAAVTPAPDSTSPVAPGTSAVSFTSTITGRIGQTTKFVCYLVD